MSQNKNAATEITEALNWRYAVKKFDATKKISGENWKVLTDSLKLAPSSYGLQPYKFFVIENTQVREKLRAVSWNQSQVTDASHFVVLAFKEKLDVPHIDMYIDKIVKVRGVPKESLDGYRNMIVENLVKGPQSAKIDQWAAKQAYIAMGTLLETAALLQVDACPMEGLDPAAYDQILGFEGSGYKTVATVALGYRHAEDAFQNLKKVRLDDDYLINYIK